MNFTDLLNRITNEDIIENTYLLDEMCNENIDNELCYDKLVKETDTKINEDLYSDLEVFEDFKGNKNTILEKLNNTNTDGGKFYLKKLLENPSNNFDYLNDKKKSFQNLFQVLENNQNEIQKF